MNTLQLDDVTFELEEATIYGTFAEYGHITWDIGIFPHGEGNYIMFNSILFKSIYSPASLSNKALKANSQKADLYEHTVVVNGDDRFLESIDLKFGEWNSEKQSIILSGTGIIDSEGSKQEIHFQFEANLLFSGLNLFETSESTTEGFLKTQFPEIKNKLTVTYQNVPSGLHALITGRF